MALHELPLHMVWHPTGSIVTVLKRGHYPDTVIVRNRKGREFETEVKELEPAHESWVAKT